MEWFIIFQNLTEGGGESWFAQAEEDPYCPSLSKKQRIIGKNFKGTSPAQIDVETIIFCPNHSTNFFRIHGLYGDGYFMFFNGGCISSSTRYSRQKVCTLIYSRLNILYFFVLTSIRTEKAFQGMSKNTMIPKFSSGFKFLSESRRISNKKCILTRKSISFQQSVCHLHHHTFVQCFSPFMLLLESNLICWQLLQREYNASL